MVKTITHKHGSSFVAKITATANGQALDLAPLTITSQVRSRDDDSLMPGVVVSIVSAPTGRFDVTALDTSTWPAETELFWDVMIRDADGVLSTSETVSITTLKRVTR